MQPGLGLSAGIAVIYVEGDALVSRSETAHKAAMAARCQERPTAAGAPADHPFHPARRVEGRMRPPSLPRTDPTKRIIQ